MPMFRRSSPAALASLVLMLAFAGCADDGVVYDNGTASAPVTGNWQISSATAKVALPSVSGQLTATGTGLTGVLHANTATNCVTAQDPIGVTGTTDANRKVTLTGQVAGGKLLVTGTLRADGRSLSDATYTVDGGQCGFVEPALATVQNYSSVTGSYSGSFFDPDGRVITITANLTQSPDGDSDGNFQLNGTASLGQNGCFGSQVNVVNSQVTGGTFTLTYADGAANDSVTATGTFSTDGKTLNVTKWTLTGACGPDAGTGLLAKQ